MSAFPGEGEWQTLKQFTDWWWRSGQPFRVPGPDYVKATKASHEFLMYREGRFQVQQVVLMPGFPVPKHRHPNVHTIECHIVGGGDAWVDGRHLPMVVSERHHPKYRRVRIPAGAWHSGEAYVVNVALSFQEWINGREPTFITDDWEGPSWYR